MKKVVYGSKRNVMAADDDYGFLNDSDFEEDDEEVSEEDDEEKESEYDYVEEDEPNIEIDNNIAGKYIAECSRCQGIFISSVSESDQYVELISGTCPLCEHETDQYLKWVIKEV